MPIVIDELVIPISSPPPEAPQRATTPTQDPAPALRRLVRNLERSSSRLRAH